MLTLQQHGWPLPGENCTYRETYTPEALSIVKSRMRLV
ncbi:hypothetical protein AG1IA_06614 [Rhizoctonia solani AG-1 IA]|uniref:Uncharacterized protein n=1 Tax=Thanatephorus cucumeris (strain AG1-IA) TaxID=983506 RepID=L8WN32_THACA|nr:hypothetical protein AG1IA_06614 [Rhizoctonia solani AG-1 IA]